MSLLNILLAIHYSMDANSGASGSTMSLGRCYEKLGHDVSFYAVNDIENQKISEKLKRAIFTGALGFHIKDLLQKKNIDVIDASTGDIWFWKKFLEPLDRSQRPLIVTRSHGLEHLEHLFYLEEARRKNSPLSWKYPLYRGSLMLWQIGSSLRAADLVFALNSQESKYMSEHMGVAPEKIHTFPNGIPESFLGLPYDGQPTAAKATIKIAQIGTYIPRKGIHYANPAIIKVLKQYRNVEITFFGTQCFECQSVQQIYNDFPPELHGQVHVVPRYQHDLLPQLLKGYQIKLFPTSSEGFGKALVEAMACGLAPIAAAAAGPLDIVTDGHDAIVVPIQDSLAIENALLRLVSDPVYLDKLRINAYQTAQKYSWEEIAKARLSAYGGAISARH